VSALRGHHRHDGANIAGWCRIPPMTLAPGRAHRVDVTEEIAAGDTLAGFDYAGAFEVTVGDPHQRSPEQWVRATFEGAPRSVQWLLRVGWRSILGLRLGPPGSHDHVLGWKLVTAAPEAVLLEVRSGLVTARKVLRIQDSRVILTTFVRYERRWAGALWSVISPVHHRVEPYILGRAASHAGPLR
jgi:hypothetical protein